MDYYHDLVTEKSWQELQLLAGRVSFVLIGGWAVYMYTQGLKSKDIDIVVEFDQLARLREEYELVKNERLRKYEARRAEVQIDVYLPFYSDLGLPLEQVVARAMRVGGYMVSEMNDLVGLKLLVLSQRGRSAKGRKDFLDIISLSQTGMVDWGVVVGRLGGQGKVGVAQVLVEMLSENTKLVELGLNTHQYGRVKKEILAELEGV